MGLIGRDQDSRFSQLSWTVVRILRHGHVLVREDVLDLLASPLHVCVKQEHPGGQQRSKDENGENWSTDRVANASMIMAPLLR